MIRLLVAAGIALAVSIVGTRFLIGWLTRHRVGQPIREDGPAGHLTKAGTPTMGGIAIVIAATAGWLFSDLFDGTFTRRGILVIAAMIGAGAVGLLDDWLKVSKERNLGLNKRAKILGLLVVSIGFAVGVLMFTNVATTLSFTRFDWPGIEVGQVVWAAWAVFLILAVTNGVNLTDGLDGLAAGSAIFGFAAFVVIGFWGFRHPLVYGDQSFLDLAIVAAAMLGACTGFLWWNAAPARIFMGDTGALAIGAALACLALSTNTGLLLVLICGLNVIETISVILQVGSYRLTGNRIFRMAPIHHHFELGGWPETTVIIRFWILAGLCTALALGIYYADFVRLGVLDSTTPHESPESPERPLVVGYGVTGQAMVTALVAHGATVRVVDDHPAPAARAAAHLASVELVEAPSAQELATLVATSDAVLPSPGVPDRHPVFAAARAAGVGVLSEFDLAAAWDDRPLLAITGTDGKTTVTTLVTEMLVASGLPALAVGNTDVPLVEAIARTDLVAFVVEASSFRLGHTRHFEPAVATWLNFAEDHLDVHDTVEGYEDAKARIWADLGPDRGVAVANADDATVMARRNPRCRTVTFGVDHPADYHLAGDALVAPTGDVLVERAELFRDLPHDVSNALAASATALAGGADLDGVREVLRRFHGLAHRVSLVAAADGIAWYDDSKATAPHATLAAVRGFPSVVLIAGGRNKALDLSVLTGAAEHLRAVVAIGEAADELVDAFAGLRPVTPANSMADAVQAARRLAQPGDVVLLSPGCASFDWYSSYGERGDDFAAAVTALVGAGSS